MTQPETSNQDTTQSGYRLWGAIHSIAGPTINWPLEHPNDYEKRHYPAQVREGIFLGEPELTILESGDGQRLWLKRFMITPFTPLDVNHRYGPKVRTVSVPGRDESYELLPWQLYDARVQYSGDNFPTEKGTSFQMSTFTAVAEGVILASYGNWPSHFVLRLRNQMPLESGYKVFLSTEQGLAGVVRAASREAAKRSPNAQTPEISYEHFVIPQFDHAYAQQAGMDAFLRAVVPSSAPESEKPHYRLVLAIMAKNPSHTLFPGCLEYLAGKAAALNTGSLPSRLTEGVGGEPTELTERRILMRNVQGLHDSIYFDLTVEESVRLKNEAPQSNLFHLFHPEYFDPSKPAPSLEEVTASITVVRNELRLINGRR